METQALIIGFGTIMFFLSFLGWRFGRQESADLDSEGNKVIKVIPRLLEAVCYCMAGLVGTAMLFVLSESFAAASYGSVVRVVFSIFQIVLGLLSGLGAIGFSVVLIAISISNMVKGLSK